MSELAAEPAAVDDLERLRRWRLVLGAPAEQSVGTVDGLDGRIDAALAALYDAPGRGLTGRRGGLGSSAPTVVRWLGDVRSLFSTSQVQLLQRDAVNRLGLMRMLVEPELLATLEPDIELVALLISLSSALGEDAKAAARTVIAAVVDELLRQIADPLRHEVRSALRAASKTRRPRPSDIDWDRTIRANLRHYQSDLNAVIPETLVGHGRRATGVARHIIVAVDQSASMATSAIHAAVIASALAQMPTLKTSLVVFDTAVADLTGQLADPVDVLLSVQLGGGTDIHRAISYCSTLVEQPRDTVLIVVTDLFEGGPAEPLITRFADLSNRGITTLVLTALSDDGTPAVDIDIAEQIADLGITVASCPPKDFPTLLASVL
jgi:Mg-chelatase subunit ChlD